jgi:hypothetical protein
LREWLGHPLSTNAIEWDEGPLTILLRYRINCIASPYVALVDAAGRLQKVVDRVELATRTTDRVLDSQLTRSPR